MFKTIKAKDDKIINILELDNEKVLFNIYYLNNNCIIYFIFRF
jgi:hypothetical protein